MVKFLEILQKDKIYEWTEEKVTIQITYVTDTRYFYKVIDSYNKNFKIGNNSYFYSNAPLGQATQLNKLKLKDTNGKDA